MSSFPAYRPRRLRRTAPLRRLIRETHLDPGQLILPVFVRSGAERRVAVESMPGVAQTSVDEMLRDAAAAAEAGVGGMILFGIPDQKDATGSGGWDEYGAVQQGVRALKREFPELVVITDVCMCEYTDHGHCGVLNDHGGVDNDATLPLLARVAVSHAAAGADVVAPSDMMDGRIGAVRAALDTAGIPRPRSSVTRRSTRRRSTAPFAKRRNPPRSPATGMGTRWILRTPRKRCAKSRSTSARAPTRSWSSPPVRTSTCCSA